MSIKKDKIAKIVFVSYIDDNNLNREGYFELVEENVSYLKIKSEKNIITLNWSKVNKMKEKVEDGI